VGRGPRRFSATTTKRRVRGPLHHASLALAWSPSPAIAGADNSSPFSRRAFAPELCPRHGKKALRASPKRREAERQKAHHWFPPRRREKSLPAMRRALHSPLPRIGAGLKERRARLSARHRGYAPRVLSLDSVPGRASWNHRIQTGEPSPAPVQPAPGSPVTRRTVDAQNRPDMQCIAASPGTALVPLSKVP
jgi:hypothetical protein